MNKPSPKSGAEEKPDGRRVLNVAAKALRLSLLGWTQAEIAERLGVSRPTISEDVKNIGSDISDIFQSGHPVHEIALRLGWPVQLVWAKMLEGLDDVGRLDRLAIKTQPYDVWRFAGCHKGDKYEQAIGVFNREYSTLATWRSVCRQIKFCRRRQNLSFKHHVEIAYLEPDTQDLLLDRQACE